MSFKPFNLKPCNQIRRLSIQTLAPDQNSGLNRRSEISQALPLIHSALEETIDQFTAQINPEIFLRINKLQLNITLDSQLFCQQQDIEQQISRQLISTLEYQLLSDTSLATEVVSEAGAIQSYEDKLSENNSRRSANAQSPTEEIDCITSFAQDIMAEALLHYLEHGTLPWYAKDNAIPEAEMEQEWQRIITNKSTLETLRSRISHINSHLRLWALLTLCDFVDIPFEAMAAKTIHVPLLKAVWQLCRTQEILSRPQCLTILAFLSSEMPSVPLMHDSETISDHQIDQLERQIASNMQLKPVLTDFLDMLRYSIKEKQQKTQFGTTKESAHSGEFDSSLSETYSPQTYRVEFAGLILLYPYLPRLFKRLDWLTEDKQIKDECINSAASALIYLATGSQQAREYQMSWIKVLLARQPESLLIPDDIPLETKIINELDSVLNSLLSHWAALKNSSVTSMQSAFINRKGLLRWQDNYWQLTIEPKGMDVLIGQLPFPIETVSLLWIKQPIRVSWQTRQD